MGKKKQRGGVGNNPPTAAKTGSSRSAKDAKSTASSDSSSNTSIGAFLAILLGLPFCTLKVLVWSIVGIPFWILTLALLPICGGRPPTLQSWSQSWRFLTKHTWGASTLPNSRKAFLTLAVLEHTIKSPIFAFCWIIDEILYGRQLNKVKLGASNTENDGNEGGIDMVFVVSAYRSASTHLARSLVEEEYISESLSLVSPNSMMMSVPYLWIWNLVTWFVGDMKETNEETTSGKKREGEVPSMHPTLSKAEVRKWSREKYSKECLERHDFDPFLIDTLDLSFLSCHLNGLVWEYCFASKSPEVVWKEFHSAKYTPENKQLYEVDFCQHIDRLARKTVLFHRNYEQESNATKTAVLFKGHFLSIVPSLQHKYPAAKFITVLRDPCDRLKSAINYTAVNPSISGSMDRRKQDHWKVLAATLEEIEAEYCLEELKTFDSNDPKEERFLAIHYDALATPSRQADTISSVQGWLLGTTKGPANASSDGKRSSGKKSAASTTSKKTKKTKRYMVDKTLHEVGIDETAYQSRLEDYIAYVKGVGTGEKIA